MSGVQTSDIYRLKKLVYPRNNFRICTIHSVVEIANFATFTALKLSKKKKKEKMTPKSADVFDPVR